MFRRSPFAIVVVLLVLSATSFAAADRHSPDFADGLSGGPDYWEVTGVDADDTLSVRKKPSPRATKVTQFSNGTVLRNLGCKLARGQRWCRVERPDGPPLRGWVNGRYLRESGGPK